MPDTAKLTMIRQHMPVTQECAYLNTGSVGPMSTVLADALKAGVEAEVSEGRASMSSFLGFMDVRDDLRARAARLVNATPAEIALTHHTTDGMNMIAHGLNWQPGDEVITTNLEHPGGLFPLYVLRQRAQVIVKVVPVETDDTDADIVSRLEAAITPRTRLLALSHVAWNTGQRLPMADIAAMAHRHHVLVLIDGAQSAGAIPLDLPASNVDFYAMPGQKWLCGPEGFGLLYVRQERLCQIEPTFAGYLTMGGVPAAYNMGGYFLPAGDARRFEVGSVYRPGFRAMAANLQWLDETVGWDWIHARILHLAAYTREALSQVDGVTVITPPGPHAGLITFTLDGYDPARVMLKLAEEEIVVRFIGEPYALRISTGFYNSEADIDKTITALKRIQQMDPDELPVFDLH